MRFELIKHEYCEHGVPHTVLDTPLPSSAESKSKCGEMLIHEFPRSKVL